MQWGQSSNVAMLYRDGVRHIDWDDDDEEEYEMTSHRIFCDFVEAIYQEIGENKWFDKFVEDQYQRVELSLYLTMSLLTHSSALISIGNWNLAAQHGDVCYSYIEMKSAVHSTLFCP